MTPLLEVDGLVKHFTVTKGFPRPVTTTVRAVDGVSFSVRRGEAYGLVGRSGCGKSTVARAVLRLIEPDSGTVRFDGADVRAARGEALARLRQRMQIIFQDPYSSLNPRQTIGQALTEPMRVHRLASGAPRATVLPLCSMRSACRPPRSIATRTSSRAASASASGLRARSPSSPSS